MRNLTRIHALRVALLVAAGMLILAGTGYAAQRYIITSTKQISPAVLKALKATAGTAGPSDAWYATFPNHGVSSRQGEPVGTVNLIGPGYEGSYVMSGSASFYAPDNNGGLGAADVTCGLQGAGVISMPQTVHVDTGETNVSISYSGYAKFGAGGGVVNVMCSLFKVHNDAIVFNPSLTIIKVGAVHPPPK